MNRYIKINFNYFILILIASVHCSTELWAESTYGSVVFHNEYLKDQLDQEMSPYHVRNSVTTFIEKYLKNSDSFALIIRTSVNELQAVGIPMESVSVALADLDTKNSEIPKVASGIWIRNLRNGQEYQIVQYEALLPIDNDPKVFFDDSKPYEKLLSPNNIIWSCFIFNDGNRERMICTNDFMENYGENAPTKRSKTFAQLYELLNQVWPGDRNDLARILSETK